MVAIPRTIVINGIYTPEWGDVIYVGQDHWNVLKPSAGKVLSSNGVSADVSWNTPTVAWGNITGTLSAQTDLNDLIIAMSVAL